MHFSQIGIKGAKVPDCIGVQFNSPFRYLEQPGLSVVGVGCENGSTDQRKWPFTGIGAPILLRHIRRSLTDTEDTLVIGTPHPTTSNQDCKRTGTFQKVPSFHIQSPQRTGPIRLDIPLTANEESSSTTILPTEAVLIPTSLSIRLFQRLLCFLDLHHIVDETGILAWVDLTYIYGMFTSRGRCSRRK